MNPFQRLKNEFANSCHSPETGEFCGNPSHAGLGKHIEATYVSSSGRTPKRDVSKARWGVGYYLASDEPTAAFYKSELELSGVTPQSRKIKVTVKNPLKVNATSTMSVDDIVFNLVGSEKRHELLKDKPKGQDTEQFFREKLGSILKSKGYDALQIKSDSHAGSESFKNIGGNQLIVFDENQIEKEK